MWMRRARRMRTLPLVHAVVALRPAGMWAQRRQNVSQQTSSSFFSLHQPDATRQIPPRTAGELFFT